MLEIICALCGEKQKKRLLYPSNISNRLINENTFSARRLPENLHFQLNKCLNCGLIFSSPILDKDKIVKLYQKSKFIYDETALYAGRTYTTYLHRYVDHIAGKSKILDIGCGNGFFLDELSKLGYRNLYGVEPSFEAVSKAPRYLRRRIKVAILKPKIFARYSFDLITCFHTLDHVLDPNDFIKTAKELLKKDGKVFFVVHNTQGLSVKLLGERSPIFDVEHIYLFDKNNLRQIFERNGFKIVNIFNVKNTYPLSYWFQALPLPSLLRISASRILKITGLGSFPVSLNAGNIGIIAEID